MSRNRTTLPPCWSSAEPVEAPVATKDPLAPPVSGPRRRVTRPYLDRDDTVSGQAVEPESAAEGADPEFLDPEPPPTRDGTYAIIYRRKRVGSTG